MDKRIKVLMLSLVGMVAVVTAVVTVKDDEKSLAALWTKLNKEEQARKPKSVIKIADELIGRAQLEKNAIDEAIAWSKKMEATKEIDLNDWKKLIVQLNQYSDLPKSDLSKAFFHLLAANSTIECFETFGFQISSRAEVPDSAVFSLDTWTKTQYVNALSKHLTSIPPLSGDSSLFTGANHQFIFPRRDNILHSLATAQQHVDYLSTMLYQRAFVELFELPESLSFASLYVSGTDYVGATLSTDSQPLDHYLLLWQKLHKSVDPNQRLFVQLDLARLAQLNRLCGNNIFAQVQQKELYDKLLLNMMEQYKEHEAAIDILLTIYQLPEVEKLDWAKWVDYSNHCLAIFPKAKGIKELKECLDAIHNPSISFAARNLWVEGLEDSLFIKATNAEEVILSIYYSPFPNKVDRANNDDHIALNQLKSDPGKLIKEQRIRFDSYRPYRELSQSIPYTFTRAGRYLMKLEDAKKRKCNQTKDPIRTYQLINVTRYLYYTQSEGKSIETNVIRALDGGVPRQPISIEQYDIKDAIAVNRKLKSIDPMGLLTSPIDDKFRAFRVIEGGRAVTPLFRSFDRTPRIGEDKRIFDRQTIHTDRAIYRPGQKVHYKGVATRVSAESFELSTQKKLQLEVLDASSKVVYKANVTTSDMGSFAGSFMLPESMMGGRCSFRIDGEYVSQIRVEEYKRPSFELLIDPIKQTYTFGDTLVITGQVNNYAGISTQDIEVKLSIDRPKTYFRRRITFPELPASTTTVTTDRDGRFVWKYHLPADYAKYVFAPTMSARATIRAVCTDSKGESKEGYSTLPLSYTPYSLIDNFPKQIDLGEPTTHSLVVNNQFSVPQSIPVKMEWTCLKSKQVFETQLLANEDTDFAFAQKFPKGNYRVKLWVEDAIGRKSMQESSIYLFDSRALKLPETLNFYLRQNVDKGEFASFTMATTLAEQNVTIDLFNDLGRIERLRFKLSNEVKRIALPYKTIYGASAIIYITYVDNGVIHNVRFDVKAPTDKQTLKMQWATLRDRLTPNAEEEWKLRWMDDSKTPSLAELCVTMYDASLNQFAELFLPDRLKMEGDQSNFPFFRNPFSGRFEPFPRSSGSSFLNGRRFSMNRDIDCFEKENKSIESVAVAAFGSSNRVMSKMAAPALRKSTDQAMDMAGQAELPALSLRTELVETALFEPQLHPDAEGYCTLKFRAPQTMTEWSVKAWGYNQKGDVARLDTTVVTRKQLTVQPNVPRFFREGDSPVLIGNVANLTQETLPITVRTILYTVEGDTLLSHTKRITLASNSTVSVATLWKVPAKPEQIIYEMWATSALHSDGERHAIPLLRRDVTVNSGEPFFLKGETTVKQPLGDELKKALLSGRLDEAQIEIVQNPIYFAVKSLPLILDLSSDNALAVSNTLFARMMAQHLIKHNPEVIQLIESWEKSSDGKTSLERSAQFKLTAVDQTPFFSAINREKEAMKQWRFWINNPAQLDNSNRAAFELLKTMQQSDGGFAWFKGERSSLFISMHVAKMLTSLAAHGANTAEGEHELRIRLINYLDQEMIRSIELTPLIKRNSRYWESMVGVSGEYLSLRADYRDVPLPSKLLTYHKNMTMHIGKAWKSVNYNTQVQLAKVALSYGFTKEAKAIIVSLLEHTKVDQLGRYFPNNRASVMSNSSQLSFQIAFIDLLIAENNHTNEVKELTQWLFAQYQTQRMFNPAVATQGLNLILNNLVTVNPVGSFIVSIGGRTIQPLQNDLKSPVLTYSISANDLSNALEGFEIIQSGKSIAWGGLLYRYQSPIDEVQDKSGDLSVKKQYFRPSDGDKLTPVDAAHPLKVGDKLVMRYTIKAARDFDYVQIQDLKGVFAEPVNALSSYRAEGGLWFYAEPKDKFTNLFFYFIPKGTYTIDYPVWVNASGEYSIGTASIQSALAPEFVSFSGALRMKVER